MMESRKLRRNVKVENEPIIKEKKIKEKKVKEPKIKKERNFKINFKSPKFVIGAISFALIIASIVMLWIAYSKGIRLNNELNLIPDNYLNYLKVGVIGVTAVFGIFAVLTCWNKVKSWAKIVFAVISVACIVICAYVQTILASSTDLLNNMTTETVNTKAYSLVVLKDGEYKKIEDLSYKLLMYYDNEMGQTEAAMEKLKEAIIMMTEKTDDVHELANKLLDKSVDAILLEEAYYDIIEEEIPDFKEKITKVYEFNLEDTIPTIAKDVTVTEQPFIVYISGIDSRSSTISAVSRSDVNMIAAVNPKTKQVLLVNIPRDYYVQLNGTRGYRDKLTHAGIYGVDKSVKTIEDLLDIDINYYVRVNFNSVVKIVDAIGGIEVDSEYAFTTKIGGYKIKKGLNDLDGNKALAFARERYALPGGDATRGKNQQAVIDAVIQKVTSTTILTKFDSILNSLKGSFQTNMATEKMVELVRMQISDNAKWNVTSTALNGAGSSERTYSMGKRLLYVMIPYAGNIKQANVLINKVLDGEMLEKGSISLAKYNDKLVVPRGVYEEEKKEEPKEEETTTPETPTTPTEPETPSTGENTGGDTGNENETPGGTAGGNTGNENETPGGTTGGNTGNENETPGENTGDNTGSGSETPGENTGGNTGNENETPGENTGGNTGSGSETPGGTTGDNTGSGSEPETPTTPTEPVTPPTSSEPETPAEGENTAE